MEGIKDLHQIDLKKMNEKSTYFERTSIGAKFKKNISSLV